MKKRNFLWGMIAFLMMFATSCSNDLDSGMITTDGTAMVSFSVETPQIASRAYENPLQLQYAVYTVTKGEEEAEVLTELEGIRVTNAVIEGGSANIKLHLIADKTYKIIFWAAGENAPYAIDFEKQQVEVNYANAIFNDASADAFFACHEFTVTDAQTESVTLIRPMAQLNIGTADLDVAANLGFAPEKTEVKVTKVPTTLNLLDGTVTGETDVTFTAKTNSPKSTINFPVEGFDNLSMSYVLVGTDKKVVDIEFTYYLGETEETRTIGSVPLQRNYRTNIYGNILTKEVDVNIDLEDFLGNNDVDAELFIIAEGVKVDAATIDEATKFYINSDAGLKWVAENVETIGEKTVVLTEDIDCYKGLMSDGDPITTAPIGDAGKKAFKGVFDGQGHTIKNLFQNGWALNYEWGVYGSLGLFRELDGATVKNVVIEDMEALVEGGDISFIAGSATGDCVFENIEIKNSKIGTYNNGCGGIIGWSGAGTYTFKNIKIGSDVVLGGLWGSFDSSIGGIVGQAEPGATYKFENVEINCRIDAYNDCTASYDYYNYRMCGMIIGRCQETTTIDGANYPDLSKYNLSFNNVVVNYGDWMNYHYCRVEGQRAVRVEAGYAYGGIGADRDHTLDNKHCMECIPFDQLIGGAQYGVKGLKTVDGVTVNYPVH